jgi:hypothetical protein
MIVHVYCVNDRAGFLEAPVPLNTYLAEQWWEGGLEATAAAMCRYERALRAVQQHPLWDILRLEEPRVLRKTLPDGAGFLLPLRRGPRFYVTEVKDRTFERWGDNFHDSQAYRTVELPRGRQPFPCPRLPDEPAKVTRHLYRIRRNIRLENPGVPLDGYLDDLLYHKGGAATAVVQYRYGLALLAARTDPNWNIVCLGEPTVLPDPTGRLAFTLPMQYGATAYVSDVPVPAFDERPKECFVQEHWEVGL